MSSSRRPLDGAVVVFDLDGTLVDTAPDLIAALNVMLSGEGLPPAPLDAARQLVGQGARALMQRGFALAGRPWASEREADLVSRFVDVYRERIVQDSRAFAGLVEALDSLEAEGARFAVCTNKRTDLSVALLDGLNLTARFQAVIGADLAPASKPDARHLLLAVQAAGGTAERAVMVGDSESDIGAARNAGLPSIAVSFGYCDTPVADLGANRVIDSFDELADAVQQLLA